jgi:NAD(P)-dependent dehydrogenase (short-subunit alcohol dehydrogenase family)
MDLNLEGKVAIVTGAGRGIGRAIALALAKEGAHVVVNDIDAAAAREVSEKIVALGSRSLAITADVTAMDSVEKMVNKTLDALGGIDILVNNAGIVYESQEPLGRKLFMELSPSEWRREIELILFGTLNCIKAVLGPMIKQRSGKIVNIASDLGKTSMGVKGFSIYGAGKGGVMALTRNIAIEVAEYGINVNAVAPGLTRTTRASLIEKMKETNPEEYAKYKEKEKGRLKAIPLGRLGEPEDIAQLVIFLASGAANWITGQTYSINGGEVML